MNWWVLLETISIVVIGGGLGIWLFASGWLDDTPGPVGGWVGLLPLVRRKK